MNPFRKETVNLVEQQKYVDIDQLDSIYGKSNAYASNDNTKAEDTTDDYDHTNTAGDLQP